MAVYNDWTVEYKNGSTWTEIPNVQELSCSVGRQTAVDQWPVSSASIRVWYPEGWASPIANLTVGTKIRFFAPGRSSTKPSWTGSVRDAIVEIGIPWNSGTSDGNADFLVIECEGAMAKIGRANEITSLSDGNIRNYINRIMLTTDTPRGYTVAAVDYLSNWRFGPSVHQLNPGEGLQQSAVLSLARFCDGARALNNVYWDLQYSGEENDPGVLVGPSAYLSTVLTTGFSDTTNNATNRIYDQITFDGLADSYFTQSELQASNATFTAQSATSPVRTFFASIPPQDPADSRNTQNSADWWANAFNPADIGIASISATTNGQHTQNLDTLGVADLELGSLALYIVPVTLRGQTFYCQIEGVQVTADTNSARFTYYVTPTDTTAWFTLDSATFGVLDQNRLGIF